MFQSLFRTRQQPAAPRAAIQQINAQELAQQLTGSSTPLMIDVRTAGEYQYDGHIAGSRLLPLPMLLQRQHELPKDRPIVCVCHSGARSQVACEQLAQLGFTNLSNLSGGMIGWKAAGLPAQ